MIPPVKRLPPKKPTIPYVPTGTVPIVKETNGVLELDSTNFAYEIYHNTYTVVHFYSTLCVHCREFYAAYE